MLPRQDKRESKQFSVLGSMTLLCMRQRFLLAVKQSYNQSMASIQKQHLKINARPRDL